MSENSGFLFGLHTVSDTRLVNLVKNPVISQEWGKDLEVFTNNHTSTRFDEHIIRAGHMTFEIQPPEQEMLTLPEHQSSPPVFGGIVLLDL
jgi:hypothetical protein